MKLDDYTEEQIRRMSVEELRELKIHRYEKARHEKVMERLSAICMELGQDPVTRNKDGYSSRYGPKRDFIHKDYRIYVDQYGGYMTVHKGDKALLSTHSDRFIIPGDWIDELLEFYPKALIKSDEKRRKRAERERERILKNIL